jgi:hypothetical protein
MAHEKKNLEQNPAFSMAVSPLNSFKFLSMLVPGM